MPPAAPDQCLPIVTEPQLCKRLIALSTSKGQTMVGRRLLTS